jgi:transcriptional regulator with XRE-family HTH domain
MAIDAKPFKTAFAKVLREARDQAGFTQNKLAERAGYEVVFMSNLESGRYQPTLTSLLSIESALGLDAGELSRRTRDKMKKPAA